MSRRTPILHRIIESFFRHWLMFSTMVLIVTAITVYAVETRNQTYSAEALTQVVKEDTSILGDNSGDSWTPPAQINVNHFNDLINDDLPGGFLDQALKSAGLTTPINVDPRAEDPRYAALRKHLTAGTQSDTLFAISLTWDNKDECEAIVSALQKQYIEEVGLDQSAQSTATGRFLDTQIADYENRLSKAEQALIDYKTNNQGETPEQQSAAIGQLTSLQAQLDEAQITARDGQLKIAALQNEQASVKPISLISREETISPLETRLNDLKAELDELEAKYTPNHPEVIAKQAEVTSLEQTMQDKQKSDSPEASAVTDDKLADNPEYAELQMQLTDAKIASSTQQAEIQNLKTRIAQYQGEIKKIPEAEKDLTDKTRSYDILKTMYDQLLTQRENIRLKGNLDKVSASSTLSPIGLVYAEPTLSGGKKLLLIGGAVLLGITVGAIALVLTEWTDNTLKYEGDAELLLGVPVLALLPDAPDLRYIPGGASPKGRKMLAAGTAEPTGSLSSPGNSRT